ncbi:MAG: beta-galactosidase [Pseudomonadota bacterium]
MTGVKRYGGCGGRFAQSDHGPDRPSRRSATAVFLSIGIIAGAICLNVFATEPGDSGRYDAERVLVHLYDFEELGAEKRATAVNARVELAKSSGTDPGNELVVTLGSTETSYSAVSFAPDQPWDWSEFHDFHIAMDLRNPGPVSAMVYLDIEDIDGAVYTRAVSVPVGARRTYYAKLAGHDLDSPAGPLNVELNFASGLRGNPPTWASQATQFVSLWGKKNLNLQGITRLTLSTQSTLRPKRITIDNLRLSANPPADSEFLSGIVDEFGQNAKAEFGGKVHSLPELHRSRDEELKILQSGGALPDRSRYSGWKGGPQLRASGYFRTEKLGGRWHLVDPDGYLYFATGLDIIRLANSTTMTGFDFAPNLVEERSDAGLTPEDSVGLNRVSAKAVPSRHLVSPLRADMFSWLPEYDEPLGKHFGYRREAHSGPLGHGETYSFYSANLERKYARLDDRDYLKVWEDVTVDRMLNWGFTSLGNWTDPRFYAQTKIPFFANGWIIGDFKTVSSGDDFWAPLPDVFDPVFSERAYLTVAEVAREVTGTPWCVGVFIDNEKSFGRPENDTSRLGLVIHTLRRSGKEVPTKSAFTGALRKKYQTINALNAAWQTDIASWEAFDSGVDTPFNTNAQRQDYSDLLYLYAKKYFATVQGAMRKHMPDHLYLGSRFPDWGMPIEVVRAAAEHVDVVSYNSYKEGLSPHAWEFLEEIDKPSIIGEFHIGASDSGLFHPGLIHASDQNDRARMYREYMDSVLANPYFVGAHWFQYIDSPVTGRAHDGENYNVGFVSVADVPYAPMVRAAKDLHTELYPRLKAGSAGK